MTCFEYQLTMERKYGKILRNSKTFMDYCVDPARSCEDFNFPFHLSYLNEMLLRKIKQPLKKVFLSQLNRSFWAQNKNSNFHNFLPDLHNNPDELLRFNSFMGYFLEFIFSNSRIYFLQMLFILFFCSIFLRRVLKSL